MMQDLRLLCALLILVAGSTHVLGLEVPFLSARVNDYAELLSPESRQRIETRLGALETDTGAQVAVLTLPSLQDESLEEFTVRVARTWKLGRKDVNDGVLLFVSRDDRKLRIEVGYGLEGILTDAASSQIISQLMAPRFRDGDFAGGIEAALSAIDGAIRGDADAIPLVQESSGPTGMGERIFVLLIVVGVLAPFMYFALVLKGFGGWFLYLFLTVFVFSFSLALGQTMATIVAGVWLAAVPILRLLLPEKWQIEADTGSGGGGGSGGRGGRSGRSRSSGGGFSGGGGSFGGGGASGGW